MAKTREYECPKCGAFEEVCNCGGNGDIDVTERNDDLYEYIAAERKCTKCGARWTEYMRLVYDGYCDGEKIYLPNGEIDESYK